MSANNRELTKSKAANKFNTVNLTTASGAITYTARTGRAADGFIFDTFIRVTSTATYDMTITVPDGVYYGQQLHVLFEVEASDETVDVSTTTGDDATQMTGAGGYSILEWHGSTIGWAQIANSAT